MAYFAYAGSKFGVEPVTIDPLVFTSAKVYVGGWVHLEDGNSADAADAGDTLAGVIHKIVNKDGIELSEAESSEYNGTLTAQSGATSESYEDGSGNNLTVSQVRVIVNIDPGALYFNEPDVAIGTTTGSDSNGYVTDLDTSVQVDESDALTATAGSQQLAIHGLNPANSAQGIYSKYESQF